MNLFNLKVPLSEKQIDYLTQLVELGNYGGSVEQAARYLIQRGIDDALARGLVDVKGKRK